MTKESCDWVKVYCRLLESTSFMLACSESKFAPHAFLFALTAAGKARSGRFHASALDRRGAALKEGIGAEDLQSGLVALQGAGFVTFENDEIEIVNWEKYQSVYASRLTHLPGAAHPATSGHQSIPDGEPDAISTGLPKEPAPARAGKVPKPADKPYSDEFEEFWKAYPGGGAKKAAWKAWQKPGRPPLADLLAAVEVQKRWPDWVKGYIPHASTWLNQGGWDSKPRQQGGMAAPLKSSKSVHDSWAVLGGSKGIEDKLDPDWKEEVATAEE